MTDAIVSKLIEAGISMAAMIIIGGLVTLMFNQAKPLLSQIQDMNQASLKSLETQTRGYELMATRLQAALDREEESSQSLRKEVLEYARKQATLEAQIVELNRLRTEDQKRIKELEEKRMQDHELIAHLSKQLQDREGELQRIQRELEEVKQDRAKIAGERDERDKEVKTLQEQIRALSERISAAPIPEIKPTDTKLDEGKAAA